MAAGARRDPPQGAQAAAEVEAVVEEGPGAGLVNVHAVETRAAGARAPAWTEVTRSAVETVAARREAASCAAEASAAVLRVAWVAAAASAKAARVLAVKMKVEAVGVVKGGRAAALLPYLDLRRCRVHQ